MPDQNVSQRLRNTILLYATLGIVGASIIVALVGVVPLAGQLRKEARSNLLAEVQTRTILVEEFLRRARAAAAVAVGRTRNREQLEAYYAGESSLSNVLAAFQASIDDARPSSSTTNLAGFIAFDLRSNVLAHHGLEVPAERWSWGEVSSGEPGLKGPFLIGGAPLLLSYGTVFSLKDKPLCHAVALYRTTGLRHILDERRGLGKSGAALLGAPANRELPLFFPLRPTTKGDPALQQAAVAAALQHASFEKRSGVLGSQESRDPSLELAYGPVPGTDWGLVVTMDRKELFSSLTRQLWALATALVILVPLCVTGIYFALRPLAGRFILHADELESQIYEKTAKLNTELGERMRAEKDARDSEALYHSLVDTLPINILRKDMQGRITFGNKGYVEMMGRPFEELKGKTDLDLFPRELALKYQRDDDKVFHKGQIFEDIEEHRHADGRRLWVHVLKAPVRNAKGEIVGTQIIFWDVTARKEAEQELTRTAADLARSNKDLEQFAYVASHDLQEPLRMVISYTELIAKRYKDKLDADGQEFIGYAVAGALRMQRLIEDLLAYSRVGTRGKPFQPASAETALQAALDNLRLAVQDSRAEVTHDPLPTVLADEGQLAQLFQNLVGNALKFRGDQRPQIQIRAERAPAKPSAKSTEWIFSVRDNGIGIDPQFFERIFIIFQRLHGREQYPGTGIGLAICKKIVERHGGRIWVESVPGQGAAFFFTLPVAEPPEPALEHRAAPAAS
jgi:PAS domain S-box-containing protein